MKKRESPVLHLDYPINRTRSFYTAMLDRHVKGTRSRLGMLYAIPWLFQMQVEVCESLMLNARALQELKSAELVIIPAISPCHFYVMDYINRPFIAVYSSAFTLFGSLTQVPLPPSYVPIITATDRMTFPQRVFNFIASLARASITDVALTQAFSGFSHKYKAGEGKSLQQLYLQAEMYLASSDFAVEFAHPLMPSKYATLTGGGGGGGP